MLQSAPWLLVEEVEAANEEMNNSLMAQMVRISLQHGRPGFNPWVGWIPLEERMATYSSILAWRIPMDRGAWWATVHVVAKSQT